MGLSANAAVIVVTLPPVPCESICLTASWVIEDESVKIRRDKAPKFAGTVFSERLGLENPRVIDDVINRPKGRNRGRRDLLSGGFISDVPFDECEIWRPAGTRHAEA